MEPETETLEINILAMSANLRCLRVRHSKIADYAGDADLLRKQETVKQAITDQENYLQEATAELARLKRDAEKAEVQRFLR